jgi:hypothetical protein
VWVPATVSDSVSVPAPVLMRPPAPVIAPCCASVVPATVSMVPPAASTVMARLRVKLAVVCRVPPSKPSVPATSPRLPLAETESTPALRVQGVTAVLAPVSVQVLVPILR